MSEVDHYPDGHPPQEEDLLSTLSDVVGALTGERVEHLLMGGIGAYSHARPRVTEDIDVFIRPDDVGRVRSALSAAGFDVVDHDPSWLLKGWKRGVLVDVIFRSTGGIYLDDEMLRRRVVGEYKGIALPLIAPEDLFVIKALTASESNPQHFYDALGIVSRCELDWDYLMQRARQFGPRRVLSLMLFAESVDLVVPSDAVKGLFEAIHPRDTTSTKEAVS